MFRRVILTVSVLAAALFAARCGGSGQHNTGPLMLSPEDVTIDAGEEFDSRAFVESGQSPLDQLGVTSMPEGWLYSRRSGLPSMSVSLRFYSMVTTPPGDYEIVVEAAQNTNGGHQTLLSATLWVTVRGQ